MEPLKLRVSLLTIVISSSFFLVDAQQSTNCMSPYLDLAFLLDGSGSICDNEPGYNFTINTTCKNWQYILEFVHNFVDALDIGPGANTVALVTFASNAQLQWNLTAYSNKTNLLAAIDSVPFPKGTTDTTGGLKIIKSEVFSGNGDRRSVNNTCIIITDGQPTDPSTVDAAINSVHDAGITTYAVGITNQINEQTLKKLSSPPQELNRNYFVTADFSVLSAILNIVLAKAACVTNQSTASTPIPSTSTTLIPSTTTMKSINIGYIAGPVTGVPFLFIFPICCFCICRYKKKNKEKNTDASNAKSGQNQRTGDTNNIHIAPVINNRDHSAPHIHVHISGVSTKKVPNEYEEAV